MDLGAQIKKYFIENLESNREENSPNWIVKKKRLHEQRGNKVPRITGKGHVYRILDVGDEKQQIEYRLGVTFLIKRNNNFYHEEEERTHQALFYKGTLVEDKQVKYEDQQDPLPKIQPIDEGEVRNQRFEYDRRAAVQYAERWWNDYNPEFKKFDVDCTNFVSQCLYAGGAPMRGAPNRSNGWWYQNETWSYSWAVAHSLRWYLSGSNQGLIGKAVDDPTELRPGDIICYDFQGDGRWDHNTIVVAKDADGMPLVNAHTDNSRHRYWSYEDSAAWTEDCKYKFFQIGE